MTAVPATLRLRREGSLRSRAARGDAVAFAAVYERHHQALYRYCRSILRHEEDAQDALQSTMTRAFAALQDERRDFELRPWLFRIAHNEAISILRRRRTTTELEDVAGEAGEMDDRVSEREELRVLRLDLADLPERQRAALVLRELNGLSHAEIGEVLEVSPAAVKQAIFEARTALFSCREGREMACHDVRRMLSDGDGRVLRGRGVRAHLRSCPDCRRFRADIEDRGHKLRLLAPPMPTAGAAALLSQMLGGPTVKLLTCVAIVGGGAGAAIEMNDAPKAAPAVSERAEPAPRREAPPAKAAEVVPVATSAPQRTAPPARPAATREARAAERRPVARRERRRRPVTPARGAAPARSRAPAAAVGEPPQRRGEEKPPREEEPKPDKPEKPVKAEKPAKAERPEKKPERPAQAQKPAQAETRGSPEQLPSQAQAQAQARAKPEKAENAAERAAVELPTPALTRGPDREDHPGRGNGVAGDD